MTTGFFFHSECEDHSTPDNHPEASTRLSVIFDHLDRPEFKGLKRIEATAAAIETLNLAHDKNYIQYVMDNVPSEGHFSLDDDTYLSKGSVLAALRGVGATCQAIDHVMDGRLDNAFCAIRPPGHHAEPDRAMGFCLFNNAAIGALYARTTHFCHRVAIIDFDAHHGNGTQTIVGRNKGLFYASTHQSPLFPGTGHLNDTGAGVIVNAPLAAGSGGRAFRIAFETRIFPELEKFNPDLIIISAGFDAHVMDPLADLRLEDDDFFWVTDEVMKLAKKYCKGRVVSCLEGGYNQNILGQSVATHISALMQ